MLPAGCPVALPTQADAVGGGRATLPVVLAGQVTGHGSKGAAGSVHQPQLRRGMPPQRGTFVEPAARRVVSPSHAPRPSAAAPRASPDPVRERVRGSLHGHL